MAEEDSDTAAQRERILRMLATIEVLAYEPSGGPDFEITSSRLRYMVERPGLESDGRPDWLALPTGPTIEGDGLAADISELVAKQISTFGLETPEWLYAYMRVVCANILRLQEWANFASAKELREANAAIAGATLELIKVLQAQSSSALSALNLWLVAEHLMTVRDDLKGFKGMKQPTSLVAVLAGVYRQASEAPVTSARPGSRPQAHRIYAAAALADLWSELAGAPFPRSAPYDPKAQPSPAFTSRGPAFVGASLHLLDRSVRDNPNARFTAARTALKRLFEQTKTH